MSATLAKALSMIPRALTLLLIGALAVPAAAGELGALDLTTAPAPASFSLELEQALAEGSYPAIEEGEEEDATPAAELHPRLDPRGSVLERVRKEENLYQATPDPELPRKRGGFGRWLKKHWWVPVLVGVAAGVAISDSDDSNIDDED